MEPSFIVPTTVPWHTILTFEKMVHIARPNDRNMSDVTYRNMVGATRCDMLGVFSSNLSLKHPI